MDSVRFLFSPVLRTTMGIGLAFVLGAIGAVVGWGLFLFSGVQSLNVLLWTLMVGAGIGAGLGGFAAWLRLEGDTRPVLLAMALLAVATGIGGAWGGYEFGSRQEVECCAMPEISPVTYTVAGATVVANGVVMAFVLIRGAVNRKRRDRSPSNNKHWQYSLGLTVL